MKKATVILCSFLFSFASFAQKKKVSTNSATFLPQHFSVSPPLSTLFDNGSERLSPYRDFDDKENRKPQRFSYTAADGSQYGNDPTSRQTFPGTRTASSPILNFDGMTAGSPNDPTGAAGLTHYVQAINVTTFRVYDKLTGTTIGTTRNLGLLWNPPIGNGGDPVLLYDKYADRWFISQLGFGNQIYIAISTSNDPAGTYYTYTYILPDFPDYPKYSIWADGYYMTTNYLTSSGNQNAVFCFERSELLNGNPSARMLMTSYDQGTVSDFFLPMPADADGQLPPFGKPMPFISYYENSWGGGIDSLKIWNMSVDWTTPTATSTITLDTVLIPAAFDGTYDINWNDIPQPGTQDRLDGIGGVIQFRAQWRKWTGYNTLLATWPVNISANPVQRSIRWTELRQDQQTDQWSIYQESIYTPDSATRWLSGIAMDDDGNIALTYSLSDATSIYPSLAYTGRMANDPLNTMTLAETIVISGSGTLSDNRYGDYAHLALDPDGYTFWNTSEYVTQSGTRTRIYSFGLSPNVNINSPAANSTTMTAFQKDNQLIVQANNLPIEGMISVELYDVNGKSINQQSILIQNKSVNTTINTESLASGIYLVKLGKENSSFQKVIKTVIQN